MEPFAQCLIDRGMVEEIEVVEPSEVARVLDGEGDVPATDGIGHGRCRAGRGSRPPIDRAGGYCLLSLWR